MIVNDIEDFLSENDVFISGINGNPSHMDSYMTVLDFGALRTALKKNTFTQKEWETAITCWNAVASHCPIAKILAGTVTRMIEHKTFEFPQEAKQV